ncbi:MAG: hypothetical protein CMQ24_21390 [Gammaproteobacteria bacterium]|nr:hypothetical protein [Gammaproteobacteria bacterium]
MSYQVLARKYRPASFAEMVGQQHVLKALINALEADRLHHAYLFTGTRGVGKTTVGRILAKCLNCTQGVTSTPCGTCSSCVEIAEGRSVDLIEVDAASQRGVDETQQLLENVQYMPTRDRFKVYLIDEVHMLTPHSFNALLKTLEEPPPHVKFLLATTEPKKLPVTVLSRCLQFNLKNMTTDEVVLHLRNVLQQEGIEHDDAALWLLGRAADGSMRDALSLTDQAIAYGGEQVGESDVRAMLGAFDRHEIQALLEAVIDNDADALLGRVATLAEFAPSYETLLDDLLRLLHRIAVGQFVPGSIDNSEGDAGAVQALAERMHNDDVQLCYQIGLMGQRDLPLAPEPRAGFEMILLRMLAFRPEDGGTAVSPDAARSASDNGRAGMATSTMSAPEMRADAATNEPPAAQVPAELGAIDLESLGPAARHAARIAALNAGSAVADTLPETHPLAADASADTTPEPTPDTTPAEREAPRRGTMPEEPARAAAPPEDDRLDFDAPPVEPSASEGNEVPGSESSIATPAAPRSLSAGAAVDSASVPEPAARPDRERFPDAVADPATRAAPGSDVHASTDPAGAAPAEEAGTIAASDPAVEQQWFDLVAELDVSGVTQVLASHCYLIADEDGVVHLRLGRENAALWNTTHEKRIAEALGKRLGGHCRIDVEIGPVPGNTPAMIEARERARALARAVADIEGNDNIQALLSDFDGTLIRETIEPRVD